MVRLQLLIIIIFSCFFSLVGQWLPNSDFENWKLSGLSEEPEFWNTYNYQSFGGGVINAFKDTNAFSGNYALHLKSMVHFNPVNGITDTYSGIATLADGPLSQSLSYVDFPLRPIKLQGYIKAKVVPGDSCLIFGFLQSWSQAQNEYVDVGVMYKAITYDIQNWTFFEAFVYYYEQTMPEKMTIVLLAGDINNPQDGNELFVDNLSFTYYASAIDDHVQVWPDNEVMIPILDNDEGTNISIDSIGLAANGSLTQIASEIKYTPMVDFEGTDTFKYVICDLFDYCDEARVLIDVSYGLGVNKLSNKVKIFPNPTDYNINIILPSGLQSSKIILLNNFGQIVFQDMVKEVTKINVNRLNSGIYLLCIYSKDERSIIKKLITIK